MQATSADANKAASSASESPLVMWTMSEIPSSAMSLWVGPLGSTLATSRNSRSRRVRSLATACSRVRTPFSGVSALAIAMMRPGCARPRPRLEQLGVHAQRHHVQLVRRDTEVGDDVRGRRRRDRQQVRDLARHLLLHVGESIPAVHQRFSPPPRGGQVEHPIAGDGVVHGGHHRQPRVGDRRAVRFPGSGCRGRRRNRSPARPIAGRRAA